jgi:hypothetical protein
MRVVYPLALVCASLALAAPVLAQDKATTKVAAAKPANKPNPGLVSQLPTLPVADQEQMLAASLTYLGDYDCEFKQTLKVAKHQVEGYMVVTFSSKAYTMKPVRSSTGALRLEEVASGPMLLVQIPTKSMLMDTARGRRIVDACITEIQAKEAPTAENALGMKLDGQVNTGSCNPNTTRC